MHKHVILFLSCLLLSTHVMAADKALIIGVGQYANKNNNLPGIDLDVDLFTQTVRRLGVTKQNTLVLMDSNATENNIKRAFAQFLSKVAKNDRVFVYFSGHGSQIADYDGDEPDGLDEFLVTHEFDHRAPIKGVLTDDEFNQLLSSVPSNYVYAFVDACHSGTISRGLTNIPMSNRSLGEEQAVEKFLSYPGMPIAKSSQQKPTEHITTKNEHQKQPVQHANYITLSATQDDESALATRKGSIFTLGINQAVLKALQQKVAVTPNGLLHNATQFVYRNTPKEKRYTPSLNGNKALYEQPLETTRNAEDGEFWSQLTALANSQPNISVTTAKSIFKLNETIQLEVNIPIDGYLNIVTVDQNDEATVLFPNKFSANNRVSAGQHFLFSPEKMGFRFYAAEPLGQTLIVAYISPTPLNLFERTSSGRNKNGEIITVLPPLSANGMRAVKVSKANSQGYGGMVKLQVVEK